MVETKNFAKNFVLASVFVVFIGVFSLLAAGCIQEKQWPASPTPFVPSVEATASADASSAPSASHTPTPTSSHSPTVAASSTPTPVPSLSAPSCLLSATPPSFVGPISTVILAAAFKNLPSGVSTATLKCFASDPGQVVSVGSQGGAFRSCVYPAAPLGGVSYEASAVAGGVSCTASLTNGYNPSTLPVISSVSASAINSTNVSISWTTDLACNLDVVEFGLNTNYGSNATNSSETSNTNHWVFLSPLTASTIYHYRTRSCSIANSSLCSVSGDYTFTTVAPAVVPSWSFTALPASFGPLTVNASNNETATQTFTLYNSGNQALSVTACTANYAWITTATCPSSLAAGASAAVQFSFNATGVAASAYSAVLTFTATNATTQTSSGTVNVVVA